MWLPTTSRRIGCGRSSVPEKWSGNGRSGRTKLAGSLRRTTRRFPRLKFPWLNKSWVVTQVPRLLPIGTTPHERRPRRLRPPSRSGHKDPRLLRQATLLLHPGRLSHSSPAPPGIPPPRRSALPGRTKPRPLPAIPTGPRHEDRTASLRFNRRLACRRR